VPSYLVEIKEPMDLGTIVKKMDLKKYKTMGQLASDIERVFAK
jgi:transcription initiation factor TFIID subunit 2